MSLFQNYTGDLIAAATRTAEQQKMFERCMGTMHLWYGNAHIHIWMMSAVPSYATRKYDERGWCKFEKRVGGIITPSHMALDLGLIVRLEGFDDFAGRRICHCNGHELPLPRDRGLREPIRRFGVATMCPVGPSGQKTMVWFP